VSDNFIDDKSAEEESFAELFESYSAGAKEGVEIGDKIRGKIISIGRDTVFIDTGTKIDGVVDKDELLDDNRELPYKEGDILELYVVSHDGDEIRLRRALSGVGALHVFAEAFRRAVPVEGKVIRECKGGFHVQIMQKRAFCPTSQMDLKYVESPKDYLGETYEFLITQFGGDGRNIVVSRRELLKKKQEKAIKQFFEDIAIDTQLEGRVTKLMPYGAFVELFPGIQGLVHISEISWSRVEKAEEVLKMGEEITVKVIGIEQGKRPGQMKIALSIKQVIGDPWDRVQDKFFIGDKIKGKVTGCAKFGAFVEIAPGIHGLVHISEMSYKKRIWRAEDVVAVGGTVEVMIKEIDVGKKRISLSIRDAEGDPWIDIGEKYRVGQSVEGTIERKEKSGYLVGLEPGITGLLPKSKIENSYEPTLIENLRQGDAITVIVEEIDPDERKVILGTGDPIDEDERRSLAKDAEKPMGSLGEKLERALQSKND
jgi:small subunit ribosomal protein S1